MHFFKSLAALATVAFGASSVIAVPLSNTGGVPIPPLPNTPNIPSVPSTAKTPFLPRADPSSLPQILADVTARLTPLVAELKLITTANATVEVVGPILDNVKAVLTPAIGEVNALVGQPVETVLAAVDGTSQVTVEVLAQTLSNVLHLAFDGLGAVLNVAAKVQAADLTGLLGDVANIVVSLLSAVLSLVGGLVGGLLTGLLAALGPVIGDLLSILSSLGVTDLLSGLGINL